MKNTHRLIISVAIISSAIIIVSSDESSNRSGAAASQPGDDKAPPLQVERVKKSMLPEVGIQLKALGPKIEVEKTAALKNIIKQKTDEIRKRTKESGFGLTEDSDAGNRAVTDKIPIGFGSLLRTRDVRDPGQQIVKGDSRVVPISVQPYIERTVGPSNYLPVRFLEVGASAARPVARIALKFQDLPDAGYGTGFLVAPNLLMTNNHVIDTKEIAKNNLEAQFNYQHSIDGSQVLTPSIYQFDPDSFFLTNESLDYTLIRLKARTAVPSGGGNPTALVAGSEFGHLQLTNSYLYSVKQLANVIQHPQGRPKEVALQENEVTAVYSDVIRYTSDTEPGSSGSPVFNNQWKIIALHHSAGDPHPTLPSAFINNEGVRIDKIIDHIKSNAPANILTELGL